MVDQSRIWQENLVTVLPVLILVVAVSLGTSSISSIATPEIDQQIAHKTNQSALAAMALPEALTTTIPQEPNPPSEQGSTVTNEHSSSVNVSSSSSGTSAQVTVNGQDVPLPESGTIHKTLSDERGTTTLDISIDGQQQSGTASDSSVDLIIDSESSLSVP